MTKILITKLSLIVLAANIAFACSAPSPQPFDSQKWIAGDSRVRGSMCQDLIDRKLLLGKSEAEVEKLLGKPDYNQADVYGYYVITISRCNFWVCHLGVVFDEKTKLVRAVAVND